MNGLMFDGKSYTVPIVYTTGYYKQKLGPFHLQKSSFHLRKVSQLSNQNVLPGRSVFTG
jgi:hypothetical protein